MKTHTNLVEMNYVDTARPCSYYIRSFLILTYPGPRGIHRDKIPIAAGAKRVSARQHPEIRMNSSYMIIIVRTYR